MWNRRFIPSLIAVGIFALFFVSYFGYRAYQRHVEFEEFMSTTVTFQQGIDTDTMPGKDSTGKLMEQKESNATFPSSGLSTDQTVRETTYKKGSSKNPVKVRIMPPEEVALYSDGDPNAAVRVESEPRPTVPDGTWTNDELVSQWVELPDGEIVKTLAIPGMEIREGDRVSLQYIENSKDNRGNYIEVDGVRHDVSPEAADDEYTREYALQKIVWAETLNTSVAEIEQMIANRELIVKLTHESMTPEETEINLNLLRAVRPDLVEVEQAPSRSWEIEPEAVEAWLNNHLSELMEIKPGEAEAWLNNHLSEPLLPGGADRLLPVQSDASPVSNQETDTHEGLSPERSDKAQQFIDQYGQEEGLRRLREMDPEAARQFERERKNPPTPDEPETQ